jgi:hypothetical protein
MKTKLLAFFFLVFANSLFAQNYALLFDDVDDRVYYADDITLDIIDGATSFTLEAWIYPNSTTVKGKVVLKRWNQYSLSLYTDAAQTTEANDPDNGRRFYFTRNDGSGNSSGNTYYNTTDNAIFLNQWTHIAVVCDGTDTKLYANGVDVTLGTNPATTAMCTPTVTNANFYIGYGGSGTYFPGYIGKVRVIKEAIAPANFQTSINSPAYTTNANTSVLLNLPEGSGLTTVNEASSVNAALQCGGTGCTGAPTWVDAATAYVNESALTYFSIYPNPVANQNLIIAPKVDQIIQEVALSDALGRKIFSNTYNASTPIEISTQNLKSGVYFINIKNQTGVVSAKIMVE